MRQLKGSGRRAAVKPIRLHGSTVWEYAGPDHAGPIAAAVEPGALIYGPPTDLRVQRDDGTTWLKPQAPDLQPLRAELARRGLSLADRGAFYHCVERR